MYNPGVLLACLSMSVGITLQCHEAANAETFRFLSDGDVLATIEFAQIPATQDDVVSLSFTDLGAILFGFGEVYQGTFDIMGPDPENSFPRIEKFDGGLVGMNSDNVRAVTMTDMDPPMSLAINGTPSQFSLWFDEWPLPDKISFWYREGTQAQRIEREGQFLPVPEPGMSLWCVLALTAAVASARRRRSRTNFR